MLIRTLLVLAVIDNFARAEPIKSDVFLADTAGYQTYRIPGLVVTKSGAILAYCEARKSAKSDWGVIDVMLRRSTDGGTPFDPPRRMEKAAVATGVTVNNPLAISDLSSGA